MKFILRLGNQHGGVVCRHHPCNPSIHYSSGNGTWVSIIWLALIFGLVNAILRPPFKALSCLLIILTLGLFTLVINTLLFALTGLDWQPVGYRLHPGSTLVLERFPGFTGDHHHQRHTELDSCGMN